MAQAGGHSTAEQLALFELPGPDMVRLRNTVARLQAGSKSQSTAVNYARDWRDFERFCAETRRRPMPAESETLRLYVAEQFDERGLKSASVERRLAAISVAHKQAGHQSPVDHTVRSLLTAHRRQNGDDREPKKALTVDQLKAIVKKLPKTAVGARDRALLLLGFASGMRRSELSALDLADITFASQGVRIRIRKSKTDQEGKGRDIGVFAGKSPSTDPVEWLKNWLRIRGRHAGPLFYSHDIDGTLSTRRLSGDLIGDIVKRSVELIDLDPEDYAGHSLRSGFVTAAAERGVPESIIMQRTGHRSLAMVARYVRPASVFAFDALAKAL